MSKIVNLKPVFNNIIVEQVKAQEKTESGFFMPESSQKKPNVYLVKEVGPECKSGVKAGDFVVLPKIYKFVLILKLVAILFLSLKRNISLQLLM